MSTKEALQLFGDKRIRTVWDGKAEKWYFSIVDIIAALTESLEPRKYWSVLKTRLKKEKGTDELTTICSQLKMKAADGKKYITDVADQEQLFRLIQSIPSPKAEPIKQWIARVASERVDEMADPEKAIDRGLDYYRAKGYSEAWIEERMKGKDARKALTDEWKRTGVRDTQYATLTDIITKEWSGFTTREYKDYKGLRKENLRDNMTRTESALNTLAEVAATELSQKHDPKTFGQNKAVAKAGGGVARKAREELERQLDRPVISRSNSKSIKAAERSKQVDGPDDQKTE